MPSTDWILLRKSIMPCGPDLVSLLVSVFDCVALLLSVLDLLFAVVSLLAFVSVFALVSACAFDYVVASALL